MKVLFRVLLYLSLIFLVWHLYRTDLLVLDNITFDATKLFLSVLLMFAGFILVCLSWGMALRLRCTGRDHGDISCHRRTANGYCRNNIHIIKIMVCCGRVVPVHSGMDNQAQR